MGTSAKYISLGSADYRKRVSNTVRVSPSKVHGGVVHRGAPPAASGYGTRSESSFRERGHRICTSLQHGNRVLQPVLHSSKEGWGVVSHFRSSSSERLHQAAQVQILTLRQIVPQIRSEDWFVTIDLKDAYFHYIHPSVSQEVPEVRIWGQSIPVSGSSVRLSIITPHFHEMRRCNPGTSSASGYSHYELQWAVCSLSIYSSCPAPRQVEHTY